MNEVLVQFVKQVEQLELQDDLQLIIDESGFAKKGKKSKCQQKLHGKDICLYACWPCYLSIKKSARTYRSKHLFKCQ